MATIKFSEFDAGNISLAGTQLVGLSGGNSAVNARFTAADLVNGLATVTYVDSQDAGLQSQITQNTNDIAAIDTASIIANVTTLQGQVTVLQGNIVVLDGAVAALENNVSVNQDDIVVLQGNVIQIENELANIADTDNQTLSYDGATANLSISNGNNVVLQEVLDNAGNITVIQGQIADLQANGNIQLLSLDNSSNVLSISGGNTVDFTTVLGNVAGGGNPFDQNLNTTDSPTFDNLSTTGELDVNGSGTHTFEGTIEFTQIANFGGTVGITALLDEDDMVSDSATALATQQSIKAYVDAKPLSGVAIGPGLVTEPTAGDQGIGMGDGADAALQSIAIGLDADASVAFATAIGKNSTATGNFGIAIGEGATAGLQSVALGLNADASQNYVTAIGWEAVATGPAATALGHECEATGSGAIAMGSDSTATSSASLAIGYKSDVQAPYGTSIGWQNDLSSAASYTVSIGNYVANNTYTQPDAIKVCAGSTYQTQLEVRPDYLDISSDNFGIACNASVGFTFTDAINGNVTLTSLIGGGGGGANIAVATASDGQDYLTTFDTSFFITADPTSTDTGYIAMGEASPQTWGSGAFVLHGSGLGQSILTGKTLTNKIGHNGPHLGMAAWNDLYLGTRYAALYTDSSYDVTLSATSLGHVALAIDNVDKLVVDGATDKVIIETELDVNGSGTHTFEGTLEFTQLTNFGGTVGITALLDEDDMVSDSATALATQQSIKAYVDANAGNPFDQDLNTTDTPEFQGVTATTGTVRLANLTTTERNALTAANGDMVYNTTDSKLQGYQAGGWINLDGS